MDDAQKSAPVMDLPGADLMPETLELPVGRARGTPFQPLPFAPRPDTTSPGTQVNTRTRLVGNRYRIVHAVGAGATADVYKAEHLYLGKAFALKAVHRGRFDDPDREEAFLREARVLSALAHPNIIGVTDFGTDEVFGAYLVAEFLRGETLEARMARTRRLSMAFSLHLGLQLAEALRYMHDQQLIHCDIKPQNVFLCDPPRGVRQRPSAKLIDFGLSHSIAHGTGRVEHGVGGTPLYAAPEQLAGRPPHPSMDIYGVGVLLYEMVTGQPPFSASLSELMRLKATTEPPPPSSRLDQPLDERVEALIVRAVTADPALRHASMAEVVFELRTVMDMLDIPHASGRLGYARAKGRVGRRHSSRMDLPYPAFKLGLDGRLIAASSEFLRMVGVGRGEMQRHTLGSTRLGNVAPEINDEIRRIVSDREPLQWTLCFQADDDSTVSLILWIVPALDRNRNVECFAGVIVPLPPP
jgi:serine/threonine protein kinase